MSGDLSDWGDPEDEKKGIAWDHPVWYVLWRALVSLTGLGLMIYEAVWAHEVNIAIVTASLLMMGFPIARYLDRVS